MTMIAESVPHYKQLEEQARKLLGLFEENGHEIVAPAIIQPASLLLDHIGEALRTRTYVFQDRDGEEFCLRPDLTMPICQLYLERMNGKREQIGGTAFFCYNGPAFRYQPKSSLHQQPREFRQAGTERFGENDREKADAEMLAMAVKSVEHAGLKNYQIHIGDLGLFDALLNAIEMPAHWRLRLRHHFWRHESFHTVLQQLTGKMDRKIQDIRRKLLLKLDPEQPENAQETVAAFLESNDIHLISSRKLSEITERLLEQAADLQEKPLPEEAAQIITDYLDVEAKPSVALTRIRDLAERGDLDISVALAGFERRLDLLKSAGIDPHNTVFSAEFGRDLEYYTGFVFQIEQKERQIDESEGSDLSDPEPRSGQIAGGGRYDSLMSALGAKAEIPAIGFAIHTERLLTAVNREQDAE